MDISEVVYKFRIQIALLLLGLTSIAGALLLTRSYLDRREGVEIVTQEIVQNNDAGNVVVEISGYVNSPGVYKFDSSARIDDAIIAAGGLADAASEDYLSRVLNRAAKLVDGQKIFIPGNDYQSGEGSATGFEGQTDDTVGVLGTSGLQININTASSAALDELWGIGPVTAQNIIDQRPYSSVEELLTKGVVKKNVYDRNKDLLSVY